VAAKRFDPGRECLEIALDSLKTQLGKITACLQKLPERDLWWRPNEASNSAGNLVLHLSGNVGQWITSGIGGAPDVRRRDREFAERGPLPRRKLVAMLRTNVNQACRVLARTPGDSLGTPYSNLGFQMTRLAAILRIVEHFAYHSGQIAYITKLRTERDLGLTQLPAAPAAKPAKASKPARKGPRSRRAR